MTSALQKSVRPKPRTPEPSGKTTVRGRPTYRDHKGGEYSELTKTFRWGDNWVTVPSVDDRGYELSEEELIRYYDKQGKHAPYDMLTGEELPLHESHEDAVDYAKWRAATLFDEKAVEKGWTAPDRGLPTDPEKEERGLGRELLGLGKVGVQAIGKKMGIHEKLQGYAEGGLTGETQMALDPMSGNEIPAGGNPDGSGVSDDIQINVSEGEYIIPENVVRYIGVSRLEEMVEKAKLALEGMDANGRTGSDPEDLMVELESSFAEGGLAGGVDLDNLLTKVKSAVTKSPSLRADLSSKGLTFAEGGLITEEDLKKKVPFTPSIYTPPGRTYFDTPAALGTAPQAAQDIRVYTNQQGQKISVTFLNGNPTTPIPTGYFPEGKVPAERGERPDGEHKTGVDYENMTEEQLRDIVAGTEAGKLGGIFSNIFGEDGFLGKGMLGGIIQKAMETHKTRAQTVLDSKFGAPTSSGGGAKPKESKPVVVTDGVREAFEGFQDQRAPNTVEQQTDNKAQVAANPARGATRSATPDAQHGYSEATNVFGMKKGGLIKRKTKK